MPSSWKWQLSPYAFSLASQALAIVNRCTTPMEPQGFPVARCPENTDWKLAFHALLGAQLALSPLLAWRSTDKVGGILLQALFAMSGFMVWLWGICVVVGAYI